MATDAIQKVVNNKLAFGIEGEFYDASIRRALPIQAGVELKFGTFAWISATTGYAVDAANKTDKDALGGIVTWPKEHTKDLGVDAYVAVGEYAAIANVGRVIVRPSTDVKVGDAVAVVTTASTDDDKTNKIGDIVSASATLAAGAAATTIVGAVFDVVPSVAGEMAVVRLG